MMEIFDARFKVVLWSKTLQLTLLTAITHTSKGLVKIPCSGNVGGSAAGAMGTPLLSAWILFMTNLQKNKQLDIRDTKHITR
jgi:hypothetical protein